MNRAKFSSEKEITELLDSIDASIRKRYGITTKDIVDRIETTNRELIEISKN